MVLRDDAAIKVDGLFLSWWMGAVTSDEAPGGVIKMETLATALPIGDVVN